MAIKLRIPGEPQPRSVGATRGGLTPGAEPSTDLLGAVEVRGVYSLSAPSRARAAAQPVEIDAEDDDVLEIEVDGFTVWTSVARYRQEQQLFDPAAGKDGTLEVSGLIRPSAASRGPREWAAAAVGLLRLRPDRISEEIQDPKTLQEFASDTGLNVAGRLGGWLAAKLLIWTIERSLRPREGLYSWEAATRKPTAGQGEPPPAVFESADALKPMLVFVHGTASSTRGSFSAFVEPAPTAEWKTLTDTFGDRIYAFEHRTMSRSPIENAIALATALPEGANISLVSHSRGGMVGDLLSLPGLSADEIARFARHDADFEDADALDRRNLATLADLLARKKFRISRFARCASPARGTLLASENADEFLSILTNLVGMIPGFFGSPVYEVIKRITLEAVKGRWRPGLLPGIEAMIPSSPLVRLLNASGTHASGDLGVVAGDIKGGSLLKRLGVFVTDHFIYESRDNDLVVNADSMFQGARRNLARYVYDQGSDVSHFNYFRNPRTRDLVSRWTTAAAGQSPAGFRDLAEAQVTPVPIARAVPRGSGTRPVAIVVPDFMGTSLEASDVLVWPDADRLADGALDLLSDMDGVKPDQLLDVVYGDLIARLSNAHDVVVVPYDWRRSIDDAVSVLAEKITDTLGQFKSTPLPIRIVAHGLGGLIVRRFADRHADLWDQVCARPGSRVILAGSPHRGSFDRVQIVLGLHPVVQQLALLDGRRGRRAVAEIFARFPGVLESLPRTGIDDFFGAAVWQSLATSCPSAAVPLAPALAAARQTAMLLEKDVTHADRVVSLLGAAAQTVDAIVVREGQVLLHVTTEGDGGTTYESSRLPGSTTWYVDASHGNLLADEASVAVVDVLEGGSTNRLSSRPPSAQRGGASAYETRPEPVLYPTPADLVAAATGRRPRRQYRPAPPTVFRASVVHGDLRFARHPLVVGHYEGDTIIGAEAVIDGMLDGALTQRYQLGLYPGRLGEVQVIQRTPTEVQVALQLPSVAIVLGMGRMGELTASQVAHLVRSGALQYVLQVADSRRSTEGGDQTQVLQGMGLSVLLLGAGSTANISVDDSVGAILRGVSQANEELEKRVAGVHARITDVEIVELFADTAIQAAHAVNALAAAIGEEMSVSIEPAPLLERGRFGRTRLVPANAFDAWRRWEVTAEPVSAPAPARLASPLRDLLKASLTKAGDIDEPLLHALLDQAFPESEADEPQRRMRFVSLSDRARAEVMFEQRQPALIERLIASSIGDTQYRPEHGRALFELMVPNDLKDGLAQLARVVLVVDGETSAYPWELMNDGGDEPLFTRIGMVRQLATPDYRPQIRSTTAPAAYVVGDPLVDPPYGQLVGARREAEVVASLLREAGSFEVAVPTPRPSPARPGQNRPTALDVMAGLFERPYRVLHLAGHGDYKKKGQSGVSGMVLDGGVFLTAVEVRKMRLVPDLVFLNCCFIGQTGPEASAARRDVQYNRLAASISRELIEMGVRAVVACGWAVRDDAALQFATTFYEHMLQGATFGRALHESRRRTFRQFRDVNTWGAYQAYGDPDFRLVTQAASIDRRDARVAPEELIDTLVRTRERASDVQRGPTDPKGTVDAEIARLDKLVAERVPRDWLARSAVLEPLGMAYGELGSYETAVKYLRSALDTGELDADTTIRAVEQLANFEVRVAAGLAKTERTQGLQDIDAAIARLTVLQSLNKTAERFNLLGGSYKRRANLSTGEEKRQWLVKSMESYQSAHERNQGNGIVDPYPVINWLGLGAALGTGVPSNVDAVLAAAGAAARARFGQKRDQFDAVFDAVALPDLAVVRALITGAFAQGTSQQEIDRVVGLYHEAFRRVSASARQSGSTTGQLNTLAEIIETFRGGDAEAVASAKALRTIYARLTGSTA